MARTSAAARPLTDHEEIRRWAEDRGARPARVTGTGSGDDVGMIRLDFPGYSGEGSLEEVSWDEWFDKFDESNLALMVPEETSRGQKSNFNKLISRDSAQRQASARGASGSRASTANRRRSRAQGRSRRGGRATSETRASGATRSARATSSRSSRSSRQSTPSSSRRSSGSVRGKKSSARSSQSGARKSSRSARGRESRRAA